MITEPEQRTKTRPADNPKAKQTKEMRKQAGRWLSARREAAGITQAQLAEQVGYRYYTFVSQVEGGHGRVPSEHFEQWADCISVPRQDFAKMLLRFYEPDVFRLLFPGDVAGQA